MSILPLVARVCTGKARDMERDGAAVRPGAADGRRETARASKSAWAALLVVWVVWGSTFVAIRVGVESIPPLAMASLRYLVAGTMLFPVACRGGGQRLRAADRPGATQWLGMAVVGTMLLAFGNGAACYAEQTLSAGFTALLIATVPIWMVVADRVVNRRSISLLGWLAVGIGVAGGAILAPPPGRAALVPPLIVPGGGPRRGHRLGAGRAAPGARSSAAGQRDGDAGRRGGAGRARGRYR